MLFLKYSGILEQREKLFERVTVSHALDLQISIQDRVGPASAQYQLAIEDGSQSLRITDANVVGLHLDVHRLNLEVLDGAEALHPDRSRAVQFSREIVDREAITAE